MISEVDTTLSEHVAESLNYMRFSRSFQIQIRGQIAHVTGAVSSLKEQLTIRTTLSRIKGIHAIWDLVTISDNQPPKILDIGCGNQKQCVNSIGIDQHPHAAVDVVSDIEKGLPFKSNEIDHVFAVHVLEHVHHLIELMNDVHRVIKPDGVLHLMVPHAHCDNAVGDPTHIRFFNKKTISHFCKESPMIKPFKPICVSYDRNTVYADLVPVKHNDKPLEEKHFAYFFE